MDCVFRGALLSDKIPMNVVFERNGDVDLVPMAAT
jgi:hypothetical protein